MRVRELLALPFIAVWFLVYHLSLFAALIAGAIHGDLVDVFKSAYGERKESK